MWAALVAAALAGPLLPAIAPAAAAGPGVPFEVSLAVSIDAATSTYGLGTQVPFDVTVTNTTPGTTTAVDLTVQLPTGLSLVELPDPACTREALADRTVVTCPVAALTAESPSDAEPDGGPPTDRAVLAFVALADALGTFDVRASAEPTSPDADFVRNDSETTLQRFEVVPDETDLSLVLTALASPVGEGSAIEISAAASNQGPLVARDVMLSVPVPDDLTFSPLDSDPRCTDAGAAVQCTVADAADPLDVGETVDIAVVAFTGGVAGRTYSIAGSLVAALPDPTPDDATAAASPIAVVASVAAVDLTIHDLVDPVGLGDPIVDVVRVTNTGNTRLVAPVVRAASTDGQPAVDFTRAIISGVEPVSAPDGSATTTAGCTTGATVDCALPALRPGQSVYVAVELAADLGAASVTATIDAAEIAGTPDGSAAETTEVVAAAADLTLVATEPEQTAAPGGFTVFELALTNGGPSIARDAELIAQLPAGAAFAYAYAYSPQPAPNGHYLEVTCPDVVDGAVRCDLGDLASGLTATAYFAVYAPAAVGSTTIPFALRAGSPTDPDTTDADAAVTFVVAPPESDLYVATFAGPPASQPPGSLEVRSFYVASTNVAGVPDAQLTINVPPDTTFAGVTYTGGGANPSCIQDGSLVTCAIGFVGIGGSSLTAAFTVGSSSTTVEVGVGSPTVSDPNLANNTLILPLPVSTQVDLFTYLFPGRRFFPVPERISWTTIVQAENRPGLVTEVDDATLTITVPAGLDDLTVDFVPTGVDCTVDGLTAVCTGAIRGALGPQVVVSARGPIGSYQASAVAVSAGFEEVDPGDERPARVSQIVPDTVDLRASVGAPSSAAVGDEVTFDVRAENLGRSDARDAAVAATVPPGAAFVEATRAGVPCEYDILSRVVTCRAFPDLPRPSFENFLGILEYSQLNARVVLRPTRPGPLAVAFTATSSTPTVATVDDTASTTVDVTGDADTTAPVVTGATADPAPNDAGWHRGDAGGEVRFTFTGTDDSGIAPTCTTASYAGPDSGDAVVAGRCTDAAGNQSDAFEVHLRYDRSAPTSACPAGPTAWVATQVLLTCDVADATSGLVDDRRTVTLATDVDPGTADPVATTAGREITDIAGNTLMVGPLGPFAVDLADPTAVVSVPADGESYPATSTVTPVFGCGDVGSGVASCTPGLFDPTPGTHTFSVTATDGVGRTHTTSTTYTITRAILAGPDQLGDEGQRPGAGVTLTATDDGYGGEVAWSYEAGPDVDEGTICAFAPADSLSPRFTCTDDGAFTVTVAYTDGSAAASATVTLRNVAPVVAIAAPTGVQPAAVYLAASASDPANDTVAGCEVDWGDGTVVSVLSGSTCAADHTYLGSGPRTITVRFADDDGAVGSATTTIDVDRDAPTIELTTPDADASYVVGSAVAAAYTCTDVGPAGEESCTGDVPAGEPVDTAAVGPHTFTVAATDTVGNTASRTVQYDVTGAAGTVTVDIGYVGARPAAGLDSCVDLSVEAVVVRTACDSDGGVIDRQITLADVPAGTYSMASRLPSPGTWLTPEPVDLTVIAGDNAAFTTFRTARTITVATRNALTNGALGGACYRLEPGFAGFAPLPLLCDSGSGSVRSTAIPAGAYSVVPVSVPGGYGTPTPRAVDVTARNATVTFLLAVRSGIRVTLNAYGYSGGFRVYNQSTGTYRNYYDANYQDGTWPIALPAGETYRVQAYSNSPGSTTKPVTTITDGQITDVAVTWATQRRNRILTVDATTGAPLSTCYKVQSLHTPPLPNPYPGPITCGSTNADGVITDLDQGPWLVTQVDASNGAYAADPVSQTVTITDGGYTAPAATFRAPIRSGIRVTVDQSGPRATGLKVTDLATATTVLSSTNVRYRDGTWPVALVPGRTYRVTVTTGSRGRSTSADVLVADGQLTDVTLAGA